MNSPITPKAPSIVDALIPIVSLMLMLWLSVQLFGDASSSGPNQIVLTMGAAIASPTTNTMTPKLVSPSQKYSRCKYSFPPSGTIPVADSQVIELQTPSRYHAQA